MKTIVFTFSILLIIFTASCKDTISSSNTPDDHSWTILIHMAIDNNIDYYMEEELGLVSNYLATLESVEAADTEDKINIVVMLDSAHGLELTDEDNNVTVFESKFMDGYYHLTGGDFLDEVPAVSIPEINSGSPDDTIAFMNWAVQNHPASHYIYSVFNHGGGFDDQVKDGSTTSILLNNTGTKGIGFDENQDGNALTHYELSQTTGYLKAITGKKIDLVHMYACLMGGVELAYELRNNADYLLFSEELFPADEWSYEAMRSLIENPDTGALFIGKAFCDSAYNFFSSLTPPREFTLSLIDLSQVNRLALALGSYAAAARQEIVSQPEKAISVNNVVDKSFTMCSNYYGANDFYYVDLGDYCNNIIASPDLSQNLQNKALTVRSALESCVVYKTDYGFPNASGMTIFHNIWNASSIFGFNFQYDSTLYRNILAFGVNEWALYAHLMDSSFPTISVDEYEGDNDFTTSNNISPGETQIHSFHHQDDYDYIRLDLSEATPGTSYLLKTSFVDPVKIDTSLIIYNASGEEVIQAFKSGESTNYNRLVWTCPGEGIYFIELSSFFYNCGYYSISIEKTEKPLPDIYESLNDDDFPTANIIRPGESQDHTIHKAPDPDTNEWGDWDYIQLDLSDVAPGTQVKIETYPLSLETDTYVVLFDATETPLSYNDNKENSTYSRIVFECKQPGIYYIITADLYCLGEYRIDIQTGTFDYMLTPGIGRENQAAFRKFITEKYHHQIHTTITQ